MVTAAAVKPWVCNQLCSRRSNHQLSVTYLFKARQPSLCETRGFEAIALLKTNNPCVVVRKIDRPLSPLQKDRRGKPDPHTPSTMVYRPAASSQKMPPVGKNEVIGTNRIPSGWELMNADTLTWYTSIPFS